MLARKDWVKACEFPEMGNYEILERVFDGVKSVQESPTVIFDLDSTLYDIAPRTVAIIHHFLAESGGRLSSEVHHALEKLNGAENFYSLNDIFLLLGLSLEKPSVASDLDVLKEFWFTYFFSNHYLHHDRPYPGAVSFVRELHARGATIIYLSGRNEPFMGDGTRGNLVRDKFPLAERTHLFLKDRPERQDLEYKRNLVHEIRSAGTPIAFFENEPQNLVALYESFPTSIHIFVDTVCSEAPAKVCAGLYRIYEYALHLDAKDR